MALSAWVILGSALGGLARYWLAIVMTTLLGPAFPWATLLTNVLGSFVIGLVGSATDPSQAALRVFVMVGICGGFTTFSSFSLQTLELLQTGRGAWALFYVLASVALSLAGVWAGWTLGRFAWS